MQKNILNKTIASLNEVAPIMLFVAMIISFILMLAVQVFFYTDLFTPPFGSRAWAMAAAIGLGIFVQMLRLASGISVGSAFSRGKTMEGILGILLSVAIAVFESYEVLHVSKIWAQGDDDLMNSFILILNGVLWFGLALELRFASAISGMAKDDGNDEEYIDYLPLQKKKRVVSSKNGKLS